MDEPETPMLPLPEMTLPLLKPLPSQPASSVTPPFTEMLLPVMVMLPSVGLPPPKAARVREEPLPLLIETLVAVMLPSPPLPPSVRRMTLLLTRLASIVPE